MASNDDTNRGHQKALEIVVNGQRKTVHEDHLSFADVVKLAYPTPPNGDPIYTVTYKNGGDEHHANGTLVEGQSVKIKNGTIFNVTATDKS